MSLDENMVDIEVTNVTNETGEIIGFEAKYQSAGREYVISYDANFKKTGEVVTNLFDVMELTSVPTFVDAWNSVKDHLTHITEGHELTFAKISDSQYVVLGNNNAILLRVGVWEDSHEWTSWDDIQYRNDDAQYNFHTENWEHLANSGGSSRYIVREGEDDILDEEGSNLGISTQDPDGITTALGDYADLSAQYLGTDSEGFTITQVQTQSNSWSGKSHELREEGFEEWTDSNERIEIFGGLEGQPDDLVGSIELREGFLVVRDGDWNTVARLLNGDGLTIEEVDAIYNGFSDAWDAVSEYMPEEFQSEGSDLKFSVDDWGNVSVFDANGAMLGRVHTWEHTNSWTDFMDGSEYTKAHISTGFNFNDVNWNSIGYYQASSSEYTHKDGVELDASIPDETSTHVSYALHKSDASVAMWANVGGNHYLPKLSAEMVDYVEEALEMTWSDVDQVNVGEQQQVWLDNEFRDGEQTGTDTRVEYFEEILHDGGGSHYEFLGSVELRDGFIEVRDSDWNVVIKVIDVTQGKTINEIDAEYAGFKAAYDQVSDFLPRELQDKGVRFTADDWNIYAFSSAGELLSNIGFWNGEHTWTSWDGTEYKNLDTHYNFHDANWNSIANAGNHERYIVVNDGNDILDERGSNSGYTVNSENLVQAVLDALNPGVSQFLDLDVVSQARLNTNYWEGLDHDLREDGFEPWSNSEKRVDLFKAVGDNGHMERIGQVTEREGLVEIYDENWNSLARLVDGPGLSLDEIEEEFPGFTEAWEAVKNYMPSAFQPELEEQALKFSIGEWENVLVFDANGLLIGRAGVWEHTNTWTNYNDGDRYTVENSSVNFNFNDADWNNIGRYEVQSRQYTEKNSEPLDEPIPDETQEFTSYALYKENATNAEWETFKSEFDLPALTEEQQQQLGFTWDDVGRLSVGMSETTGVVNQFREEEETWSDTRVEYFEAYEQEWGTHYEFVGSMEVRAGFIEVRDSNWDIVIRKIDISSARTLSEIASMHDGFEEAWTEVADYLPTSLKDSGVKFTSDDWNIYAFSAAGELISNINFWSNEHTWEGWDGTEYRNVDSHYNFHDAEWNSLANAGSFERYASDDGFITEYLDETGSNSGFTAYDAALDTLLAKINGAVFTKLGVAEEEITSARMQFNMWKSLDHDLRDEWFEPYENSNERIELFKTITEGDYSHEEYVGSLETRGGVIEIYNDQWEKVSQIMVGDGLTIDQVEAEYAGFKTAFSKVIDELPAEFGGTLKFALGDWDSILIFDDANEMLSRVDVWTWNDPQTRYRNGEEYTRVYDSITFNFNDSNWNDIARYEMFSTTYTEKEGTALDPVILSETGEFKSVAIFKDTSTTQAWGLFEETYGLPDNLSQEQLNLLFTWDQVDQISVGTRTEKEFLIEEFHQDASVREEGRVEYFTKHEDEWGNSWYEFLGVMEVRDGFLEIRDKHWDTVAQVVDTSKQEDWDDIKGDFIKLEESWEYVSDKLPTEIQDPTTLKFARGEDELYAFDANGTMYEIYVDNEVREFTRSGMDAFEERYWYDFEEAEGPKFADIGGHNSYVVVDGGEVLEDRIAVDEDGNPINAPFTMDGKLVQLVERGLNSSSVIEKTSVSETDWAVFDPNNDFIDFSKVAEIEYGTNSWEGLVSIARENEYSDERVTIEYYAHEDHGDWIERYRLGSIEKDGFLETVYDAQWNVVDQQLAEGVDGVPLTTLIDTQASYMREAFDYHENEIASFIPNLSAILVTPTKSDEGGMIIEAALTDVTTNEIVGQLDYDEWENSNNWGWNVHIRGVLGEDLIELFEVSGHNVKDEDGDASDTAEGVGFATFRYIADMTDQEFAAFKEKYSVMENVDGFSFDKVLKIKERDEIWNYDEGVDNFRYESDVTFSEDLGDGESSWDYYQLQDRSGLITVEDRSIDEIVYTTFVAPEDAETLQERVGPNYDAIATQINENHENFLINNNAEGVTIYILQGDEVVAVDENGEVLADGWWHSSGPHSNGQLWWEITLRDPETGERLLHFGGQNELLDEVSQHLEIDGPNSTRVGDFYYKEDMAPEAWSELMSNYAKYADEVPDGTFENTGALGLRYSLLDRTGDGNYSGSWVETQFGLLDEQRRDGIDWSWETTVKIREEGLGYTIEDGRTQIASGTDMEGIAFVDPSQDDLTKFNAMVDETDILETLLDNSSLKAVSGNLDSLVLQDNQSQEIMALVRDYGGYYGFHDPETNEFVAWIWSEEIEGINYTGYAFDIEDLSQGMSADNKAKIETFLEENLAPSNTDYAVADISEHRLVVRQAKDGGEVVQSLAYVQHIDAYNTTLGSTGVDLKTGKFAQWYDRPMAVDGETATPTTITAAEVANIAASISEILNAIIYETDIGTLEGLDADTVIEPLPGESGGYDFRITVNADNLLALENYKNLVDEATVDELGVIMSSSTAEDWEPVFGIGQETEDLGLIDFASLFTDNVVDGLDLATAIMNWPSLIPELAAATSGGGDYGVDIGAMTLDFMGMLDGERDIGTGDENPSDTTSTGEDFIVGWEIDSMEAFKALGDSSMSKVAMRTHLEMMPDGEQPSDTGSDSGEMTRFEPVITYLEDATASALIEIHSITDLSVADIDDILDIVMFDAESTYANILDIT